MKRMAHVNPKSYGWVIGLAVMAAASAAVVLGSEAVYESANRKFTEPAEISFTIESTKKLELSAAAAADDSVTAAEAAYDASGRLAAYIITGTAAGYNAESPIELAVTISADGALVCGVDILHQEETEYLGEKIASDAFTDQFTGRYLPVIAVGAAVKGSPIDTITRATISSKAVIDAVNRAHAFVLKYCPIADVN